MTTIDNATLKLQTPAVTVNGRLNEAQVAQFWRDGYIAIERLIDDATVLALREYYDAFLRREIQCGEDDRHLGGLTRQVKWPSKYHPYFEKNAALAAGNVVAAQLLGGETRPDFNMLISKEPGNLNETPWHQDFSYWQMPFIPAGTPISNTNLQLWLALDDVDPANGCMHFIPGAHTGAIKEHYVASGDPNWEGRLLATKAFDGVPAVACPLKAGGCTIHTEGSPHFTSGNVTKDRQRRAYIFNFSRVNSRTALV